ncbi:MAG: WYL domain-containing protein [Rothia sp. (in: high G+C Gram-positive bacteria)]|nr:WYL domain-containing protein [Rothia sp. (in: high G+C Gram-positive bacteria)]
MTSKAVERALVLLDVLSDRRYGLDRNEIRQRIPGYAQAKTDAAFERMFERDKDVLRSLGVELLAERSSRSEAGFIYRIDAPALSVSFSAVDVLVLSHIALAWADTALERTARSASLKIGAQTGQKLTASLGETAKFSDVAGLAECLEATAEGKGVSFIYTNGSVRKVSCWGLGLRFGHWYIYGWDRGRGAERIFRLDRMQRVKIIAANSAVAPDDFSMRKALARVNRREVPLVASCAVSGQAESSVLVEASYSPLESALAAVSQGRSYHLEQLPRGVDPDQQRLALAAEETLRVDLAKAHREPVDDGAQHLTWKPLAAQRARETASEQIIRTVLMLTLIGEAGVMALEDLADFFDQPVSKVRAELEDVAGSLDFGSLDLDFDHQGGVSVRGGRALSGGAALTAVEVALLILALELAQLGDGQLLVDRLAVKLADAIPGGLTLRRRFSVYTHDINAQIQEAIGQHKLLKIWYSSYRGESVRLIEPLSVGITDGPRYLRAWCRLAQDYRNFRLDRIATCQVVPGETFTPRLGSGGASPAGWLEQLGGWNGADEALIRVEQGQPRGSSAADLLIQQYAHDIAEGNGANYYHIPVVNKAWLFELLVSARGRAALLEPESLRKDFLRLLATGASEASTKT